jgi:hypothetical protein
MSEGIKDRVAPGGYPPGATRSFSPIILLPLLAVGKVTIEA